MCYLEVCLLHSKIRQGRGRFFFFVSAICGRHVQAPQKIHAIQYLSRFWMAGFGIIELFSCNYVESQTIVMGRYI